MFVNLKVFDRSEYDQRGRLLSKTGFWNEKIVQFLNFYCYKAASFSSLKN